MTVVRFSEEDVIATSLFLTMTGFGNGNAADSLLQFGSYSHAVTDIDSNFKDDFNSYFGTSFANQSILVSNVSVVGVGSGQTLQSALVGGGLLGDDTESGYNGRYKWDATAQSFSKQ